MTNVVGIVHLIETTIQQQSQTASDILHEATSSITDTYTFGDKTVAPKFTEGETLENMDAIEDVYKDAFSPDDFVISGRWVKTERSPRVHRARWVLRCVALKVKESDLVASYIYSDVKTLVACCTSCA